MNATRTPAARSARTTSVLYWSSTVLLAALMLEGGIVDVVRTDSAIQVMHFLGYPAYFATILGAAKLLGVAAILLPVPPMLREWAYAGFTFDVTAAIASLVAVGAVNWTLSIPVVALAIVQASYWTWRRRSALVAAAQAQPSLAHGLAASA